MLDKLKDFLQQQEYQQCELLIHPRQDYYFIVELKKLAKIATGYNAECVMTDESMLSDYFQYITFELKTEKWEGEACIIRSFAVDPPYTFFYPVHYKVNYLSPQAYRERLKKNHGERFFLRKDLEW